MIQAICCFFYHSTSFVKNPLSRICVKANSVELRAPPKGNEPAATGFFSIN